MDSAILSYPSMDGGLGHMRFSDMLLEIMQHGNPTSAVGATLVRAQRRQPVRQFEVAIEKESSGVLPKRLRSSSSSSGGGGGSGVEEWRTSGWCTRSPP